MEKQIYYHKVNAMLITMKVQNKRFLINEDSPAADENIKRILSDFPKDALIEFEKPSLEDVI
tara:strand:- start:1537 stop:1722 length:186 start_codon:yes stop_codon:yes gene_type:complete